VARRHGPEPSRRILAHEVHHQLVQHSLDKGAAAPADHGAAHFAVFVGVLEEVLAEGQGALLDRPPAGPAFPLSRPE
jgi:hypothetical protein